MRTCLKMKEVVDAVSTKFAVDFSQFEAHIRLDLPGFDRLIIENIGGNRIVVAHYFEANGDLVPEPDVVFYTAYEGGWLPIEITQSMTGYTQYVKVEFGAVTLLDAEGQNELAFFADQWAQNLMDQGWLDRATRHIWADEIDIPF